MRVWRVHIDVWLHLRCIAAGTAAVSRKEIFEAGWMVYCRPWVTRLSQRTIIRRSLLSRGMYCVSKERRVMRCASLSVIYELNSSYLRSLRFFLMPLVSFYDLPLLEIFSSSNQSHFVSRWLTFIVQGLWWSKIWSDLTLRSSEIPCHVKYNSSSRATRRELHSFVK